MWEIRKGLLANPERYVKCSQGLEGKSLSRDEEPCTTMLYACKKKIAEFLRARHKMERIGSELGEVPSW